MKCLVTGSSGFIGRALVERLKIDHEIYTIHHEKLHSQSYLKGFVEEVNPDFIFHLAAYGNMGNQQDDDEILKANILGTYNLLKYTKDIKYKAFFNFSSSSVYGKRVKKMQEDDELRPDTMYAATKASVEYLCRAFRKKYHKKIITIRPFSVYGPGEAIDRFIPTLVRNTLHRRASSVIRGSHDWIYIDDFVNGVMKLVESHDELTHRTYNIGTGVMNTNDRVAALVGGKYELKDYMKIQDSQIWVADNNRMLDLNWEPKVSLDLGVELTREYYAKQ